MSDELARQLAHGYGPPVTPEQVEALRRCVEAFAGVGYGRPVAVPSNETLLAAEAAVAALARAVGGTP